MTIYSSGKHESVTADSHPYHEWELDRRLTPAEVREANKRSRCWRGLMFDPRPEFDRPLANEANPILGEFRKLWVGQPDILEQADYYARYELDDDWESPMTHNYTQGQRDHARRVLTRLANLTEGATN